MMAFKMNTKIVLIFLGICMCHVHQTIARSLATVRIPIQAKPGHIVTFLPNRAGQAYKIKDSLDGSIAGLFTVMRQGQLITTSPISNLQSPSFNIYVEHIHPTVPSWSQMLHIEIDNNSKNFYFPNQPYRGHISENKRAETRVEGLENFYADIQKLPFTTSVTIVSGARNKFEIKKVLPWTGNDVLVMSRKVLDRELRSSYHITVNVRHGNDLDEMALISIDVDDENDNRPVFTRAFYTAKMQTNMAAFSPIVRVTATDRDENDVMSYSLKPNAYPDFFSISETTGDIILNEILDGYWQSTPWFKLVVVATDQGGLVSAPAAVDIYVQTPEVELSEDLPHSRHKRDLASQVFIIDRKQSGDLFSVAGEVPVSEERFMFVEPSPEDLQIETVTGMVSLETGASWNATINVITFDVNVSRIDDSQYQEIRSVLITLVSRDQDAAIFTNEPLPLAVMLPLWIRPYTPLLSLSSEDALLDADVRYRIEAGSEGRFSIDSHTGVLSTVGRLPFNCTEPYQLSVSAQTVGVPLRENTPIQVVTLYCRELDPQFYEDPYIINLNEREATDYIVEIVQAVSFFDLSLTYSIEAIDPANLLFAIDAQTGAVTATEELKYEVHPHQFRLNVSVIEQYRAQQSSVLLIINLQDVNNFVPFFPPAAYVARDIVEDTAIDTFIQNVIAYDYDSGVFGELSFTISDDHFSVTTHAENNSAVIRVAKELDYDLQPNRNYEFEVMATDGGGSVGQTIVRVWMVNINDNAPVFTPGGELTVLVRPEAALGTLVHVVQAHDPDGDQIAFRFDDGTVDGTLETGKFKISATSGAITVNAALDQEDEAANLTIIAQDDGSCCEGATVTLQSEMTVIVRILRANRPPLFPNCAQYQPTYFAEEQDIGTLVTTVEATDPDGDGVAITIIDSADLFALIETNENEAELRNLEVLDREQPTSGHYLLEGRVMYPVTLSATDNGEPPLTSTCFFFVNITDVNDNAPEFDTVTDVYEATVLASAGAGQRVTRVFAWDPDDGDNALVNYDIAVQPQCGGVDCFTMSDPVKGWITLNTSPISGPLEMVIRATDQGVPSNDVTVPLTVHVVSAETDLPPSWNLVGDLDIDDLIVSISENATERVDDVGTYSVGSGLPLVTMLVGSVKPDYEELNSNEDFEEDHEDGTTSMLVLVNKELDYEETSNYVLLFLSRKLFPAESPISSARLQVAVQDVNDMTPFFIGRDDTNIYPGAVPEETDPPQIVTTVFAIDLDGTYPNNKVTYYFSTNCLTGDCEGFLIDPDTGVITSDRKFSAGDTRVLNVTVKDGLESWPEDQRRQSWTRVTVQVTSISENPPYFESPTYNVDITERFYYDEEIITIKAITDDNIGTVILQHDIISGNDMKYFSVDKESGVIKAYGFIQRSQTESFTLQYRVFDGFTPDEATVTINVISSNLFPPIFDVVFYEVTNIIEEDVEATYPITIVEQSNAVDPDPRDGNTVYLTDGLFSDIGVFEASGSQALMTRAVDRDFPNGYANWQFNMAADDENSGPDSKRGFAIVNVKLIDINDNNPIVDRCCVEGSAPEHQADVEVIQLVAYDYDEGPNAVVTFELEDVPEDGSTGALFQIDPTSGLIQTTGTLIDREVQDSYTLTVVARDNPLNVDEQRTSRETIYVTISDINDNPPVFPVATYEASMPEEEAIGSYVTELLAEDLDIGENAWLNYTVLPEQNTDYFYVDSLYMSRKGAIKVNQRIDYETLGDPKLLNIRVSVSDGFGQDEADVTITVTDINDNAPVISPQGQNTTLPENGVAGVEVASYSATDADSGINQLFDWSIDYEGSDVFKNFAINQDGVVSVRQALDYEQGAERNVHVLAIDRGEPSLTGTSTLTVFVEDLNDNAPYLVLPAVADYPVAWRNQGQGTEVARIPILDKDGPDNGAPFTLQACQTPPACNDFDFSIDGEELVVTARRNTYYREDLNLDFYTIPIVISDSPEDGQTPMTGTSTLTIIVESINANQHTPGIKSITVYNYNWELNNVNIGHVFANDVDDWDRDEKTYEFVGSHEGFSLDGPDIILDNTVPPGVNQLQVRVSDAKWGISPISTVNVNVVGIDEAILESAGSIRFSGTTSFGFLDTPGSQQISKFNALKTTLARILATDVQNVDIINVRDVPDSDDVIDVIYVAHGSPYYRPSRLNGVALQQKSVIEQDVGLTILMTPVDECLTTTCWSTGCSNTLLPLGGALVVNSNTTSLVGINAAMTASCTCTARDFTVEENPQTCNSNSCLNGGTCVETWADIMCECPPAFDGPRCQQLRHSFSGNSWAWYEPLKQCEYDTLSLQFATSQTKNSLLLYNGPMSAPGAGDSVDFLALELNNGYPYLRISFGSGVLTLELDGTDANGLVKLAPLYDGEWHTVEIIKNGMDIRMVVDHCAVAEVVEGILSSTEDRNACEAAGTIQGYHFVLLASTPLQLGGRSQVVSDGIQQQGFDGCIQNLRHNGLLYDLHTGEVGEHLNSADGCGREDLLCEAGGCPTNSTCSAGVGGSPVCRCLSGLRGVDCDQDTSIKDIVSSDSFLEWQFDSSYLQSDSNNVISLMFRTRTENGLIFSAASENKMEHIKLVVTGGNLAVRYDLGSDERILALTSLNISDGVWHNVEVHRQGNQLSLLVDEGIGRPGEGRYYVQTTPSDEHRLLSLSDTQIFGGSDVIYRPYFPDPEPQLTIIQTCLNDIRYDSAWMPMVASENDESAVADVTNDQNTLNVCEDGGDVCATVVCDPDGILTCINGWRIPLCVCPIGTVPDPVEVCRVQTDCSINPCVNGVCIDLPNGEYECECFDDYQGTNCDQLASTQSAGISTGVIIAIVCSLLVLLLLILLAVIFTKTRRREPALIDDDDDDVREYMGYYNEEGAGEEDTNAFDITQLQKARNGNAFIGAIEPGLEPQLGREFIPQLTSAAEPMSEPRFRARGPEQYPHIGAFIDDRLLEAEDDPSAPPYDTMKTYEYQGSGSEAGSLSSLNSSSTDRDQDYDYLNTFGPRFAKLADIYGPEEEEDDEGDGSVSTV